MLLRDSEFVANASYDKVLNWAKCSTNKNDYSKGFIELVEIFSYMKDIPLENQEQNNGFDVFNRMINDFKKIKKRKIVKLTEEEKAEFIKEQNNISSFSEAPVLVADDIEVDHIESLANGSEDKKVNFEYYTLMKIKKSSN